LFTARRELHSSGAVILFCDDSILSSDEREWEQWAREAVESEAYSRRHSRRVTQGNEAKWRRHTDPTCDAPLGYRRAAGKPALLQVDPARIGMATRLYERYALGHLSIDELAAEGIAYLPNGKPMSREGIADVLANGIYRGEVAYKGETGYRDDLRVMPDADWWQVQDVRLSRVRGGGPHKPRRVDLLSGLLYCDGCGTHLRSDGYSGSGIARKRHANPCASLGKAERLYSRTWEGPIVEQVTQLDLSDSTLSLVRAALTTAVAPLPDQRDRKRIESERGVLARRYELGEVTEAELIYEGQRLKGWCP